MRMFHALTAWLAKKYDSERFGKTCRRQATNQCQAGNQSEQWHSRSSLEENPAAKCSQINQELAHESVQRWQPRYGNGADQKSECRPRHSFQYTAELVDLTRACAV